MLVITEYSFVIKLFQIADINVSNPGNNVSMFKVNKYSTSPNCSQFNTEVSILQGAECLSRVSSNTLRETYS